MLSEEVTFTDLGLKDNIINALNDLGYKKPSPIQLKCIPSLLDNRDVLGIAQTGSGKTAAFALPLINNINPNISMPQVLIMTPTRELAIQVKNACLDFSKYIKGINVISLYGGQSYDIQFRGLNKGPQVIVGTPGRLLDHLKRRTLDLYNLKCLVLDEADEMLRMGFIEDVENILKNIPLKHQTALFSATMPEAIRRITYRFMHNPYEICIKSSINTIPDIIQKYCIVRSFNKTIALLRFIEIEDFDAAIIFVRTKSATLEVAEVLYNNGYNSAALNGDMNQVLREKTLDRLRKGNINILIATDIAARGLDIDRISLVINYDIPIDAKSYVHRIGRTGRAGRTGHAILFVENSERSILRNIERIMKINMIEIEIPSAEVLSASRIEKFSFKIENELENSDIDMYRVLLNKIKPKKFEISIETMAAVLLKLAQSKFPLILNDNYVIEKRINSNSLNENSKLVEKKIKMNLYRIELGKNDGIEVRNIVGAIANECKISNRYIGNIKLFSSYSTIELPKSISNELIYNLNKKMILNKPINIKYIREVIVSYKKKLKNIINKKDSIVFRKKRNFIINKSKNIYNI